MQTATRPKMRRRVPLCRLRPCRVQDALGRSIALGIDAFEFLKGHRLKRSFSLALLRECHEVEALMLKIHDSVTGIS